MRAPRLAERATNQTWLVTNKNCSVALKEELQKRARLDCTREVVGWSLRPHMESSLVKEALSKAVLRRRPAAGLLHHSDRGIQYTSGAYQALLTKNGFMASMSRKGNCYDNAAMEAFWSTLKTELVHQRIFRDEHEARRTIFEYIEVFYNRERLHSVLGYQSPVDFAQSLTNQNN